MTTRGQKHMTGEKNKKQVAAEKRYNYIRDEQVTRDVMIALRDGNPQAFEIVYLTYAGLVENFIGRLTNSRENARDITHDIFISLWEKHERINPDQSIAAYLFQAARNRIYRHYHENKRFDILPEGYEEKMSLFDSAPDEEMIAKQTELLLRIAVDNMPEQRKAVFELSQQGFSYEEIATKLGITNENARKHLSLARKDLEILRTIICILMA